MLKKLYNFRYELPKWFDEKSTKGFLIYFGHNHFNQISKLSDLLGGLKNGSSIEDSLLYIGRNDTYKVYSTAHGVLVKKGDQFKWVFVTDHELTGAPDKLRWPSI